MNWNRGLAVLAFATGFATACGDDVAGNRKEVFPLEIDLPGVSESSLNVFLPAGSYTLNGTATASGANLSILILVMQGSSQVTSIATDIANTYNVSGTSNATASANITGPTTVPMTFNFYATGGFKGENLGFDFTVSAIDQSPTVTSLVIEGKIIPVNSTVPVHLTAKNNVPERTAGQLKVVADFAGKSTTLTWNAAKSWFEAAVSTPTTTGLKTLSFTLDDGPNAVTTLSLTSLNVQ